MVTEDCPVDIVCRAAELASELVIGDIPLDFDPGQLRWRDILALIADEYSNHADLLEDLDQWMGQAAHASCDGCDLGAAEREQKCVDCSERWLAEHELRTAALDAAERAYQRWLARRALRRAAARKA